jgi:predicted enzyme related to lactoylglutathione lyase
MGNDKHPTMGNGKICYLEIPTGDVKTSVSFYKQVFGWQTRQRGDGSIAFDDAVGEVSGTWVLGRSAATEVGLLIYIMVDSVTATIDTIVANGGKIVQPIGMDAPEITARFADPFGNIMGLYQEPAHT